MSGIFPEGNIRRLCSVVRFLVVLLRILGIPGRKVSGYFIYFENVLVINIFLRTWSRF